MVTLSELDKLSRDEMIAKARVLGVQKPELLTRVELSDEIIRVSVPTEEAKQALRGWFGVARDLVAGLVEAGLHLPEAAAKIRGENWEGAKAYERTPVATVTLAEIYMAQRHYGRALSILDEVLAHEPDHEAARELRGQILKKSGRHEATAKGQHDPEPSFDIEGTSEVEPIEPGASEELALRDEGAAGSTEEAEYSPSVGLAEAEPIEPGASEELALRGEVAAGSTEEAEYSPSVGLAEAEPTEPGASEEVALRGDGAAGSTEEAGGREEAEYSPSVDAVYYVAGEGGFEAYFELARASLEQVSVSAPGGCLVARWLFLSPNLLNPARRSVDIQLQGLRGTVAVESKSGEGAVVRLACGWLTNGRFKPLAIGVEIEPESLSRKSVIKKFVPPKLRTLDLVEVEARAVNALKSRVSVSRAG